MCSSISVRLSIFHQPEDNAFFLESTIAKRTQLFVSVKLYDKTTIESRHTLHHLKDKQRHHVKYSLWNKIYGHDLKVRLKHGVSFRSLWFFLSKWFSNIFVKINCSVSIFYCMLFSVDILLYVVQCRYSTVCCSVSIFYYMLFSVDILLYVVQCRYSTVCCSVSIFYYMLFSVDILLYVVQCRYSTVCCSVSIYYCMLFSVDILLYVVQCRYSTVCIVFTCSIIIIALLRLCLCPNEWASEHEQYSFNAIEHLFNYIMAWTIYVLMKWWWWWWRSKCVFYYTKHAQFTHF